MLILLQLSTNSRWRFAGAGFVLATCLATAPAALALAPTRKDTRPTSQSAAAAAAPAAAAAEHGSLTATLGYGSNSSFFGRTQSTAYLYSPGKSWVGSRIKRPGF